MHFVRAKGILSAKNYMNIYRGCSHGCIYCDGRSKCYDIRHDFEDIEVKENAPQLLEEALRRKREKCVIGTGGISDSYIPAEMELGLTRRCLEIIDKYGFGVTLQTKSDLILRDLDILKSINEKATCVIQMTLTACDDELSKIIEPNVCPTLQRFETLLKLKENGIDTVVWLDPLMPYITDSMENIDGLLSYCRTAGVKGIICYAGVTLRDGNREYFYKKLERHFPQVLKRYLARYNNVYDCRSENADIIEKRVKSFCSENNVLLNDAAFEFLYKFKDKRSGEQLSLF